MLSARDAPRFTYFGEPYVIVRRGEVTAEERAVALEAGAAERLFAIAFPMTFSQAPVTGTLGSIALALRVRTALSLAQTWTSTLEAELARGLSLGRLLLIEARRLPLLRAPGTSAGDEEKKPEIPFDAEPPAPFHWIEILIQGGDGKPLPNVRVRLTDPDGAIRDLATDSTGMLRLDVREGQCRVEVLGHHGEHWSVGGG
jgi:hypothetical protein